MPFLIYADCEALCTTHEVKRRESQLYSHHVPCLIRNKLATAVPGVDAEQYHLPTGPDVLDWFMRHMLELEGR